MTPTARRKFIYESFTPENQWRVLAGECRELADAIEIGLDRMMDGKFAPEDAKEIIKEFGDVRNPMQQIDENEPQLSAKFGIEQDLKEIRTIERIETGYYEN